MIAVINNDNSNMGFFNNGPVACLAFMQGLCQLFARGDVCKRSIGDGPPFFFTNRDRSVLNSNPPTIFALEPVLHVNLSLF
jgi:hypothetical protein